MTISLPNVYCIWYPSGGFGHYINSIISLYGKNFCRPRKETVFSSTGNSHNLDLVAPKYSHDPEFYSYDFDQDLNYTVLIDNGINNESNRFKNFFPDSKILKIVYSEYSWPIVAKTMIIKAQNVPFDSEVSTVDSLWNTSESWALREKYFLYLRDHSLRHRWNPDNEMNIDVIDLADYSLLKKKLNHYSIETTDFEDYHKKFLEHNKVYFDPVIESNNILFNLTKDINLTVDDIWTQAVLYYFIWVKYGVEVPHNDYSNWFTTTKDIVTMLSNHGVYV